MAAPDSVWGPRLQGFSSGSEDRDTFHEFSIGKWACGSLSLNVASQSK